jgi:hypothetical protein
LDIEEIMKTSCFYLLLLGAMIFEIKANYVSKFPVLFQKKASDEFSMLAYLAKKINEKNDEKNFLKLFNIFINTYNTLKQNHVDQGQKKLAYSLLNNIGKKLVDYVSKNDFMKNNKALNKIFESLEVFEDEKTSTKKIPFKWGK